MYLAFAFRRRFYRVYINGNPSSSLVPGLKIANHSSWWDGLVLHYINEQIFQADSYAMMGETGLRQFPFFRKLGAFSVNSGSASSLRASLKYAEQLLRDGKNVWIFPQGEEVHLEKRPLQFRQGAAFLLNRTQVPVQPIAFYYTFTHHSRPELFIRMGEPIIIDGRKGEITNKLEEQVEALLDQIKEDLAEERLAGYRVVLGGPFTISEWITALRKTFQKRGDRHGV